MLIDIIKQLSFFLLLTVGIFVERSLGLPVWTFFYLWHVSRKGLPTAQFVALWVVSAFLLSISYQFSLTIGFVICLVPLSYVFHKPWWHSQTLAMVGCILAPVLAIAVLTQVPWSWLMGGYVMGSWLVMVVLVKTWLIDRRTQLRESLKIEWRWLERLRTS